METTLEHLKLVEENSDEDYDNFFLQPTAFPYNIAEKVKMANEDLFNDNNLKIIENKQTKVKFKEDLVDYEPSLTEDDVNSIESDCYTSNNERNIEFEELKMNERNTSSTVIDLKYLCTAEEEVEEAIEEEEVEDETVDSEDSIVTSEITATLENLSSLNTQDVNAEITYNEPGTLTHKSKLTRLKKHHRNTDYQVECKNHCIERLDFGSNLSINKLQLHEKTINCPKLKLQERKCCEENKIMNPQNLPCYSGFRSEYGLTSLQLERREKRKEIIRQKAERRRRLAEEYKERKKQQNEEVFCQWLKEITKRKKQKPNETKKEVAAKETLSPAVINFSTRTVGSSYRERPKTASNFVPSHNIKHTRRPHTSPAKVYVEVPRYLLKRGVNVGSLLITTSKSIDTKSLHVLTVS